MRRVVIESPYAAPTAFARQKNCDYARAAMADCLRRGEAPIASHLLYTQRGVLRDEVAEERALGIAAGLAWGDLADAAVFYVDRGWSSGMEAARDRFTAAGKPIEVRMLGDWE